MLQSQKLYEHYYDAQPVFYHTTCSQQYIIYSIKLCLILSLKRVSAFHSESLETLLMGSDAGGSLEVFT